MILKDMRKFCIYGYTRERDSSLGQKGSFYYIGKGIRRRSKSPQHSVAVPRDSSRIVTLLDGISEEYAFEIEALLISLLGRADIGTGTLRNRTDGGQGISGYRHTEQAKARIHHRLSNQSPESIARRAASITGRVMSPEGRRKISTKNTGRKFTEEMRARMSAAHVGGKQSDATRAKMSASRKLWWDKKKQRNYDTLN